MNLVVCRQVQSIYCLSEERCNGISDVFLVSWKCSGFFVFFTGTEIRYLRQTVCVSWMFKYGQDSFQLKMVCILTTFWCPVLNKIIIRFILAVLFVYQVNQDD